MLVLGGVVAVVVVTATATAIAIASVSFVFIYMLREKQNRDDDRLKCFQSENVRVDLLAHFPVCYAETRNRNFSNRNTYI